MWRGEHGRECLPHFIIAVRKVFHIFINITCHPTNLRTQKINIKKSTADWDIHTYNFLVLRI